MFILSSRILLHATQRTSVKQREEVLQKQYRPNDPLQKMFYGQLHIRRDTHTQKGRSSRLTSISNLGSFLGYLIPPRREFSAERTEGPFSPIACEKVFLSHLNSFSRSPKVFNWLPFLLPFFGRKIFQRFVRVVNRLTEMLIAMANQ